MSDDGMSLDDFMGHSTSSPKGAYLSKWKDRVPPRVNTLLHRTAGIHVLWRHQLPRVVVLEKENETTVWGGNYKCWEVEALLKKQFRRLDDDTRVIPPETCPLCKMIEWVYQAILDGKVKWTDELFKFEADDPKKTRIIHAGGLTNMFNRDDLSDEQDADLRSHGIFKKDAWQQNAWAKAGYMFQVVDVDEPSSGVQIAIESALLGDKVRQVIADRRVSLGKEKGDPTKYPYVIQWEHNPARNIAFNKKYHARPMDGMAIPEQALDFINGEPQDVTNITRRFNAIELRAALEDAALVSLPWDEWFPFEEKVASPAHVPGNEYKGQPSRPSDLTSHVSDEDRAAAGRTGASDDPVLDDEEFDCSFCDKGPVKGSDKLCPFCGVDFETGRVPEPVTARRKRGQATPDASLSQLPKSPAETSKPKTGKKGAFADDDNDVPF